MKLSQEKKQFVKISSLARVMAKKPSKNVLLANMAIFDGFMAITPARDDIFANCFFSWLSFIYTQLLIPINPKSGVIYFLTL